VEVLVTKALEARAESPLYNAEDLAEDLAKDEGFLFFDEMLEDLRARRKKAEQK
jgi:hypothetical protein